MLKCCFKYAQLPNVSIQGTGTGVVVVEQRPHDFGQISRLTTGSEHTLNRCLRKAQALLSSQISEIAKTCQEIECFVFICLEGVFAVQKIPKSYISPTRGSKHF